MQRILTHINLAKGFRGGERQTFILIQELSKKGYRQRLVTRKGADLAKRCKDIKDLTIIEISKPYIFWVYLLKDSLLIHAHETKALQLAFFVNLFYKVPYIVTRRVDKKIKNNFFSKQLYKKASYVAVLSTAIKNSIKDIVEKDVVIIPSSYTQLDIDNKKVENIKSSYHNKFVIGNIGAFDGFKGQEYIVEVAKSINHDYPDIHFVFLGSGDKVEDTKEQAKKLTNITFVGFVNDVQNYIATFDLFVFPSLMEGLGSILLDVMKSKVPIVASNVGGIPDIIKDDENGILVEPKNPKILKDAIMRLYHDRKLRDRFVENSLKKIKKYSPLEMANSYERLYKLV